MTALMQNLTHLLTDVDTEDSLWIPDIGAALSAGTGPALPQLDFPAALLGGWLQIVNQLCAPVCQCLCLFITSQTQLYSIGNLAPPACLSLSSLTLISILSGGWVYLLVFNTVFGTTWPMIHLKATLLFLIQGSWGLLLILLDRLQPLLHRLGRQPQGRRVDDESSSLELPGIRRVPA
jgi:hypothetical protein